MKKFELVILYSLVLAIVLTSLSSFSNVCASVRDDTLRLHILANSNSEIDQNAKLYVRDEILKNHGEAFSGNISKSGARITAQNYMQDICKTAQNALEEKGLNYSVKVSLVNMYFATTVYTGFTLPAGKYDAVRVELGQAKGKNWFCVLFPPLCVPAAMDDANQGYSQAESNAVKTPYKIKFALVEWAQAFKENSKTSNN